MFKNTTIRPRGIALIVATILFETYLMGTMPTLIDLNRFLVRLALIVLIPATCAGYFFVMHYGKLPVQAHKKKEEAA